jgi:hypothetical protein
LLSSHGSRRASQRRIGVFLRCDATVATLLSLGFSQFLHFFLVRFFALHLLESGDALRLATCFTLNLCRSLFNL